MKIAVPKKRGPQLSAQAAEVRNVRPADDYHAASEVYVPHLLSGSIPCGAKPLAAGRRDPSGR